MAHCLACNALVEPFMSFGKMPIANGFLRPEEFDRESFFDLQVGHCTQCHMVQLTERLDPARLFHPHYAYFSSTSLRMVQHFQEFAEMVRQTHLPPQEPFVIEIGSNDGIMLQNFAATGIRHLGIEPSTNVAQVAVAKGVKTLCRFFDEETGEELRRQYGPADVVLGANVICHLPNIHSVIRGIQLLLKEEGVFIFEEPYLSDIIQKTAYDQIYDEHVFYFSLRSLTQLLSQYEMEIADVTPQNVHGGSLRYVVGRRGVRPVRPAVWEHLSQEEALGLTDPHTYQRLRDRIYRSRDQLRHLLIDLKSTGKRISGYGATSKSTTVTNFCGIGPDVIEYISDTTPGKQGRYSPGVHIPVVPYERFREKYPDYALLFAWNHAEEILAKEHEFRRQAGKFITYVPAVQTLE